MLEGSEYSPWVKTIFASIKLGTFFRGIRSYDRISKFLVDEFVFKSQKARQTQWDHWNYSADRVDRRLAREPEHADLWTKILAKHEEDGGLNKGEHVSVPDHGLIQLLSSLEAC